jgi:uncharacterized protein (TIGR03435 family)
MSRTFATSVIFSAVVGLSLSLLAQSPPGPKPPAFEVASIKRNTSANETASLTINAGRLTIRNGPLRAIIRSAFALQAFQVVGGPDWIDTDGWDVTAKAEAGAERQPMGPMMQSLLADSFKLVAHKETRNLPIYALVFARQDHAFGPKFHASSTDCQKEVGALIARTGRPPSPDAPPLCGIRSRSGHIELNATRISPNFVRTLAPITGRSVVDKTELTGVYDADLVWNDSEEGPSLFTAIQEQLGLKLEAQRGPVDVLVIDRVERPTSD